MLLFSKCLSVSFVFRLCCCPLPWKYVEEIGRHSLTSFQLWLRPCAGCEKRIQIRYCYWDEMRKTKNNEFFYIISLTAANIHICNIVDHQSQIQRSSGEWRVPINIFLDYFYRLSLSSKEPKFTAVLNHKASSKYVISTNTYVKHCLALGTE